MSSSRLSAGRIVVLTIAFVAAGIAVGAVAGVAALATVSLMSGDLFAFHKPALFPIAATLGALIGAVCGPVAGWLVHGRVPPGRAVVAVALGTIAGGVVGWYIPPLRDSDGLLIPPALGFVGVALLLRISNGRRLKPGA